MDLFRSEPVAQPLAARLRPSSLDEYVGQEHLLARGDLTQKDRDRAQHALALDFLKAGLLDRAEAALRQLEHSAFADEARQALLGIFERARDWPQAIAMAEQLDREHAGAYQTRLAHFYCELAAAATKRQAPDEALQLLQQGADPFGSLTGASPLVLVPALVWLRAATWAAPASTSVACRRSCWFTGRTTPKTSNRPVPMAGR